jgi:plasmid stabilization system protein ParE
MNKKYEVISVNIAENDLSGIIEYIANASPSSPLKILKKIKEKATSLNHSPKRGCIIPELQEHGILQYREIIISHWRIIFRISDRNVYVLGILDSRQNIEDILLRRLINLKI